MEQSSFVISPFGRWRRLAPRLGAVLLAVGVVFFAGVSARAGTGTVVRFTTVLGVINVELTDDATPLTVANFLQYVNEGAYTNSVIHRNAPGFVIQGGGFLHDYSRIPTHAPVQNEFHAGTNLTGTIAMAKTGGDPNSATDQFFFNLKDNTSTLDPQNGGFTSFGNVLGDGMTVVNAISALPYGDFSNAAFGIPTGSPTFFDAAALPLRNYTQDDYDNAKKPDDTNLVIISSVVVVPAWQNPLNRFDVNHDGSLAPIDALNVINELNANGTHSLATKWSGTLYYDVDGNKSITALDALQLINQLNSPSQGLAATSLAPPSALGMSAVPEPSSIVLAGLSGLGLLSLARRAHGRSPRSRFAA